MTVASARIEEVRIEVDMALRVVAVEALDAMCMGSHATVLRQLPETMLGNARYASDKVHAAFVAARRKAHEAMAGGFPDMAERYALVAACCHACADAAGAFSCVEGRAQPGLYLSNARRCAKLAVEHRAALAANLEAPRLEQQGIGHG